MFPGTTDTLTPTMLLAAGNQSIAPTSPSPDGRVGIFGFLLDLVKSFLSFAFYLLTLGFLRGPSDSSSTSAKSGLVRKLLVKEKNPDVL